MADATDIMLPMRQVSICFAQVHGARKMQTTSPCAVPFPARQGPPLPN